MIAELNPCTSHVNGSMFAPCCTGQLGIACRCMCVGKHHHVVDVAILCEGKQATYFLWQFICILCDFQILYCKWILHLCSLPHPNRIVSQSHPTKTKKRIKNSLRRTNGDWRSYYHLQSKRRFHDHMLPRAQEFEAMLQPYGAPPRCSVCGCFSGNNVLGVDRFGDSGIVKCW